jgi:hypothetical protein
VPYLASDTGAAVQLAAQDQSGARAVGLVETDDILVIAVFARASRTPGALGESAEIRVIVDQERNVVPAEAASQMIAHTEQLPIWRRRPSNEGERFRDSGGRAALEPLDVVGRIRA